MFEMNNAQGYGFPQGQMMYNGIQPQAMPKRNNVLTDEEIKKLQANRTQFTLTITEDEHLRAVCNHRSADGLSDALEDDPMDPNIKVCKICGQKFIPINYDAPKEYVQEAVDNMTNIIQTIKLMYRDFPAEAARAYFDILPLIGKIPQLFEYAVKNMAKYEMNNPYGYQNNSPSAISLLSNMMGAMGAGGFNFAGGAQPQYNGMPQGQPQNYPGNPFGFAGASQMQPGYGMPMGGYQPQNPGFMYTPQGQPQQQAAPEATSAEGTTTTTQNTQA